MNPKTNANRWIVLLATAMVGSLIMEASWAANPDFGTSGAFQYSQELARVGATQGETKIQRAGEAQFKKLSTNEPLYLMDFLSTARGAKIWWKGSDPAWWPFAESTHGSLGENTIFGFASFQKSGASAQFTGQVNKGIVRFIKKLPMTDPPSRFSVRTPTAWIDVMPTDRAADFVLETVDESRTTVTVIWGEVKVRNVSEQLKEERVLTSCQEVDVEKDKEPGEIRWVSSDTMKNLIKRTTIPNTLPTDVPSCERLKTEVILRPGAVLVPPPGVVVVPVPVPTPPTQKCPCPPGSYVDPATNQCSCCPPGRLYNEANCDCACPCPPNHEFDPTYQKCVPCRQGSTNGSALGSAKDGGSAPCRCSCPCPQGQALLPGTGCVPECPRGFTLSYDTSEGLPHRCPICVQSSVPLTAGCTGDTQCGRCETCVQGNCVRKTCPEGQALNERCECAPLIGREPPACQEDAQCPACQKCREGKCVSVITCPLLQKLNLATCQCEGATTTTLSTGGQEGCQANSDCDSGQVCRRGKCVNKPVPRKPRGSLGEETFSGQPEDQSTTSSAPPLFRPRLGIGIGSGSSGGGGGGGGTRPGVVPRKPIGKPN